MSSLKDMTTHQQRSSLSLDLVDELFHSGRFDEAISFLSNALKYQGDNYYLRLRRADCYQQVKSYEAVITDCNAVINWNPIPPWNVVTEAYLKRSHAFQQLEEFQLALNDIESALLCTPSESPLRLQLLNKRTILRQLLQRQSTIETDKAPVEFYSSLYRIHVKNSLPGQIVLGHSYTIEVRLTNEFGLFKSEEIKEFVPIPLKCSIFVIGSPPPLELKIDPSSRLEVNEKGRSTFRIQIVPTNDKVREGVEVMLELRTVGPFSKFIVPVIISLNCYNATTESDSSSSLPLCLHSPLSTSPPTDNSVDENASNLKLRVLGNNNTPFTSYRLHKIGTKNLLIKEIGDRIATKVWDCAIIMSHYFEQVVADNPNFFVGKRVIELGSGTGFLGLACWALGSKSVTLTDLSSVLPHLVENVEICRRFYSDGGELEVSELCWGQTPLNDMIGNFDIIIASDVIYELEYFPALLHTINEIATTSQIEIYLGYRARGIQKSQENEIFTKLEEIFSIEDLDCSHIECFMNARIIRLKKKK